MQILNISVMNRPQKSVTSRPYPIEFIESFTSTIGTINAQQSNLPMSEESKYGVGVMDCIVRELLIDLKVDTEVSEYSLGIADVQVTKEVVYRKHDIGVEPAEYSVGIEGVQVTRFVNYLSTGMDTEVARYSVGIADVRITK